MNPIGKYGAEMLREAFTADYYQGTWFKDNEPDSSICLTLDQLTAEQASAAPTVGRSTIAAQANHLLFSLDTYLAYTRGEQPNPDWSESWAKTTVTEEEWAKLRSDLRERAGQWIDVVENIEPEDHDEMVVRGLIASVAHSAYHLGAIRQLAADMVTHG